MEVVAIFAILDKKLLAVKFAGEELDEFVLCFENWSDPGYLENFFEENIEDLKNQGVPDVSVEKAVLVTMQEAHELEQYIRGVAQTGSVNSKSSLGDLVFHPLSPKDFSTTLLKTKAYGRKRKSWLRLYAIQISYELFVVCGSAIKLTRTNQERQHTNIQLAKLEAAKNYLKETGLLSEDDYQYLELGNDEDIWKRVHGKVGTTFDKGEFMDRKGTTTDR